MNIMKYHIGFNSIEELLKEVGKKGIKGRRLDEFYIVRFRHMYYLVGIENVYKHMVIGKKYVYYRSNGCFIKVLFNKFYVTYRIKNSSSTNVVIGLTGKELLNIDSDLEIYSLFEYALNGNLNKVLPEEHYNILAFLTATFSDKYYSLEDLNNMVDCFDKKAIKKMRKLFKQEPPVELELLSINPYIGYGNFNYKGKNIYRMLRYVFDEDTSKLLDIKMEEFWEYWIDRDYSNGENNILSVV